MKRLKSKIQKNKLGFNSFRHEMQTPTMLFSTLGFASLLLFALTNNKYSILLSYIMLNLAGGGVAMAMASEVRDKKQEWGWKGLWVSKRNLSKLFFVGFWGHIFQFIIAHTIAIYWWKENHK